MAEEQQVLKEPQQVMKEPQQVQQKPQRVTTKDPKKVEAGKRLAAHNRKKREAKKREEQMQSEKTTERGFNSRVKQYYGIGFGRAFSTAAVIAVGVIGGLGYYIYRTKQPSHGVVHRPHTQLSNHPQPPPRLP